MVRIFSIWIYWIEKGRIHAKKVISQNKKGLPTGPDEYTIYRKDKSTVIVEITTYPIKIGDKDVGIGIARDITKHKRTEKDLSERNKELNCLYSISKILENPNISIDQTLQSKDYDGHYLMANKFMAKLHHTTRAR